MTTDELRILRRGAQEALDADRWNSPPLSPQRMLELLDEVERLSGECAERLSTAEDFNAQRVAAATERDALRAERDALRCEVEDWKQRVRVSNEHEDALGAEADSLRAEVARMRPVYEFVVLWRKLWRTFEQDHRGGHGEIDRVVNDIIAAVDAALASEAKEPPL